MSKIKICGLFRECDIDYVNEAMPDYIGFVFAKSPRQVSREQAHLLRSKLHPGITAVGVFVNEPLKNVVELLKSGTIQVAQLHGSEDDGYIWALKELTGKPIIKSISVRSNEDIGRNAETAADFLLLDNGKGGTGASFDWKLIGELDKPYFLAGGLSPENLSLALAMTSPYGVDLSSGVETDGVKDRSKILKVVQMVRGSDGAMTSA